MDISGNSILITGGATGIGYALAEAFLAEGNEVIICGRREERLLEAKSKHPELHFKVCDVADAGERRSLAEWINVNHGGLNILVNNAGIMSGENEITINLEAPIILTRLFTPILKGKKGAAIINISSGLGFVPAAKMPVYSATKAGLHVFSMAIRHQLLKTGIKVFEVVPPAVDTELNPEGRARRGSFKVDLKPGEFVAAVMKSLKNDIYEIGYGMTEGHIRASREDLDTSFTQMNSRW
jgi:uncharacterized oxidoreductase